MTSIRKKKKYVATLPSDFQEVLMSSEMELQQGLNVPILRKLVYLYTRGMQYYDLIHKEKFREFYYGKLKSLLTKKDVEEFLDKNPINFEDKEDLDKIFEPKETTNVNIKHENLEKDEKEEKEEDNVINDEVNIFAKKVRNNSMTLIKKKINDFDINLFIKKKLLEVSSNLNKIDQAMTNEMIEQMSEFEANKRKRKIMKSKINNKENQEDKNSDTNSISTPSSNGEEQNINDNIIKSAEDELKILELSGINSIEKKDSKENISDINNINININIKNNENTPTKNIIGNNPMLREIEDYVQKNMNEMYQALEELKASFQEEISEAEENGFQDIADGLKEDLQAELDNLKDQYEEQRKVETEKIKAKYSKRNNLFVN